MSDTHSRRLVWVSTCPKCNGVGGYHSKNLGDWVRCGACHATGEIRTELTDAEREAIGRAAGLGVELKGDGR